MYAVAAFFDPEAEAYLQKIWEELCERSISFYSKEVEDRKPHITIADYDDLDKQAFISRMDKFYKDKKKLELNLNVLGTFLNTGTLFLAPTMTQSLRHLHKSHHDFFSTYSHPDSLYTPEKWVPHSTIASRLNREKMMEAFDYCANRIDTIHTKISSVALLEFHYEDDNFVGAPPIHTIELKN